MSPLRHLGDKHFQAVKYTDTDNRKHRNRITHSSETQNKANQKLAFAVTNIKLQNLGLVAFYDSWSENRASIFLHRGTRQEYHQQ